MDQRWQRRFTDSGQSLGDHRSYDVTLGDVDGDGDLDAFVANLMKATEFGSTMVAGLLPIAVRAWGIHH